MTNDTILFPLAEYNVVILGKRSTKMAENWNIEYEQGLAEAEAAQEVAQAEAAEAEAQAEEAEYVPEDDCPLDGDAESALASAGFGTDEDYGYYGGDEW